MANPTGFLDYEREEIISLPPLERVKNNHEFHILLDSTKQEDQAKRCMQCGVPFCQAGVMLKNQIIGCPNLNLIPEWNDLLSRKLWDLAYYRLSMTMPFPEITGRICPAPCESSCVCNANNAPVTIRDNELALAEYAFANGLVKPRSIERNGRKVAIVGSGPAGLACANELNLMGFEVEVFERDDRVGGLLMYGIPDAKLEKSVVERRIDVMKKEGIKFHTNHAIDSKVKFDNLLKKFDKVVLALGARKARELNIEGENLKGVYNALDFLTANTKNVLDSKANPLSANLNAKGKNVVVIGSGDTSTDCVAVALRQGAKSVVRLERSPSKPIKRKSSNPWPEPPLVLNTDYGIEEAISLTHHDPREFSTSPKVLKGDKSLQKIITTRLEWSVVDGRRKSSEILNSSKEIKADMVLKAMGFSGVESNVADIFGVAVSRDVIVHNDFATSRPNVYACGDCKIGASLVVTAIKEGRECAKKLAFDMGIH
ncbi:glutamate synthase small subunit [Helicobacter saguini]|uniref:Glutamate synthase small subunit n=1 Tax=Helicobacter saguini TaxID=1548018 RepID=A0A347VR98_9HELI|nr:glutamate synthase subunit beta [Helicobacter saguini]MWV62982.1 glutamate synthase small subunit [Helicobacter saguini]MWV66349.1 glutamate synthase small subunit [Helicobacter saguini]MWV68701.1 glutamate synthase small subunit [Helicobacter saguini]MWV71748.1 glutamate synthase small subunit [Helicobacter saguini]TLD91614.1 glutamate synthase subunit beta [Helicobacter saguini]